MLNMSWAEVGVVAGVGLFFIGRKDLPRAARVAGTQVGRVVGLIQGARARADRFAQNNELKQLQNELRSGLRELDVVRSELATSMAAQRTLGSMVPGANRPTSEPAPGTATSIRQEGIRPREMSVNSPMASTSASSVKSQTQISPLPPTAIELPPERQTFGAVAEEEWNRRGIGFVSVAERGTDPRIQTEKTGSATLAFLLKESLLFSQYDRIVQQQQQSVDNRIQQIEDKVMGKANDNHEKE